MFKTVDRASVLKQKTNSVLDLNKLFVLVLAVDEHGVSIRDHGVS